LRLNAAPDGSRNGSLEVMLVAYDPEGKPLNLVMTKGEMKVSSKDYAAALRGGLQIHKEIDVPQGDVYLRTGIYDLRASSAGTLAMPLKVSSTTSRSHP